MTSTNPSARIALVTGGSRGLGKNTALHLAREGVGIILTYVGNRAAAEQSVADIQAAGVPAVALQLDLARSQSFPAFAQAVRQALQTTWNTDRLTYLINNGGMGMQASIADTTEELFDQLSNVHLKGTFFLTQALLPLIADGGRIINTSGIRNSRLMKGTSNRLPKAV